MAASPHLSRSIWRWCIPLVVLLIHRLWLFMTHGEAFARLVAANPGFVLAEMPMRDALVELPVRALIGLQHGPPLPSLLMAGVLAIAPAPLATAWTLVALQVLATAATALGILALADRVWKARWPGPALAVLWVLSPDAVVFETHSLGQLVHDTWIAPLLVLATILTLTLRESPSQASGLGLGAVAATLALLSPLYSLIALPLIVVPACSAPRGRRLRTILAVLVAWLALHGTWTVKNGVANDDWRLWTSTDRGVALAESLQASGQGEGLQLAIADDASAPKWFRSWARETETSPDMPTWEGSERLLPVEVRRADVERLQWLEGHARAEGGARLRLVSDLLDRAWRRHVLEHPRVLLFELRLGLAQFWFPIRQHGRHGLSLFAVEPTIERSLRVHRRPAQLLRGELPESVVRFGGEAPAGEPVVLGTLDTAVVILDAMTLVAVHTLLPIALGVLVWRRRPGTWTRADRLLVASAVLYAFALVHGSLLEQAEAMRLRLHVAPLLWLATLECFRRGVGWARASVAGRGVGVVRRGAV
ncbi:MAG: hypothetical protein AAGN46_10925 [Acidobacteriota bacterium]